MTDPFAAAITRIFGDQPARPLTASERRVHEAAAEVEGDDDVAMSEGDVRVAAVRYERWLDRIGVA